MTKISLPAGVRGWLLDNGRLIDASLGRRVILARPPDSCESRIQRSSQQGECGQTPLTEINKVRRTYMPPAEAVLIMKA